MEEGRVKLALHVFQLFLGLQITFSCRLAGRVRWMCLGAFPSLAAGGLLARLAGLAGEISAREISTGVEKLALVCFPRCRQ